MVGWRCNICRASCWQSRTWYFRGNFWRLLAKSGHFCGRGASLRCRNHLLSRNIFTYSHLLEREGLVANVSNTCRVPWQSKTWHFVDNFWCFLANSDHFSIRAATLWCKNIASWALITLLRVIWWNQRGWLLMLHLSWPLTERNVTFWGICWTWLIQAAFVVGEPFCDVGFPSWVLISLIRIISWK